MRVLRQNLYSATRWLAVATAVTLLGSQAATAVELTDGFEDADRNNDGTISFYDTDVNLSDTFNTSPDDDEINGKGLIEVTAANDASDTGIVWHATRGFTSSNTGDPKPNAKIINDNVPTGAETADQIHNSGLALGYEAKGTGSSMIGNFGQTIRLGPNPGNKIVASIDFRFWRESNNPTGAPNPGELRWGLFQDTDNQLGMSDAAGVDDGSGQATVVWGQDDGDWRSNDPGPVGDRGIWARIPLGPSADPESTRIVQEYNLPDLDGSNNARFLEGSTVGGTSSNRDTSTFASAPGNGPGGIVGGLGTHTLSMEIIRTIADDTSRGIEVATFIDGVELIRDEIKSTDSGADIIGLPPDTFDYVGFRNASGDSDYVFDNFSIRTIPEPATAWLLGLGGLSALVRARRRS